MKEPDQNGAPSQIAEMDVQPRLNVARSYQLEMFESSLKGNTIVVMDTGSGKTHVATLRIMHELEHSHDSKFIWFLAPTVALCIQQYNVLELNLPSVSMRLITGSDNVQRWSTQAIWDNILGCRRLIVSTHAILSDALDHGFVTMRQLGLLVFDEAHHCSLDHPANRIMKNHYHPYVRRVGIEAAPCVLGLTASPVMRAKVGLETLRQIEGNLNAIAKTPRVHLQELREFVHLPVLVQVRYMGALDCGDSSLLPQLRKTLETIDILKDPCIVKFRSASAPEAKINEAVQLRRTRNQDELRRFLGRAEHVNLQLGAWAGDLYISLAIARMRDTAISKSEMLFGWEDQDRQYLCSVLLSVGKDAALPRHISTAPLRVSQKFTKLVQFLGSLKQSQFSGIVFVDQRATATTLCKLLSAHPSTCSLQCSTFLGTSDNSKRRGRLGELADTQSETLDDFRTGKCDLIIATNILEEGIDISSCNLVICFDKPQSLKSFIQRRGRARDKQSTFLMMIAEEDDLARQIDWNSLEEAMIKTYQNERRQLDVLIQQEEAPEHDHRRFEIEATGALLTPTSALQKLNHFCNVLPRAQYVNNSPIFTLHGDPGTLYAEVLLPNCVDVAVRRCSGSAQWHSERHAKKDVAFRAYINLYHAGLVNEHLLPILSYAPDKPLLQRVLPCVPVAERINPWVQQSYDWMAMNDSLDAERNGRGGHQTTSRISVRKIIIKRPMQNAISVFLLLPEFPLSMPGLELFWKTDIRYKVNFDPCGHRNFGNETLQLARDANSVLLQAVHTVKMLPARQDLVAVFVPHLEQAEMENWIFANSGTIEALEVRRAYRDPPYRVVRSHDLYNTPLLFNTWVDEENALEATSLPRRRNFLPQGRRNEQKERRPRTNLIDCESATFDKLSTDSIEVALLIPSVLHHIERVLVASDICSVILEPVGFNSIRLVMEAITASSASETENYQRLEFIGDSTLKFLVAAQLFTKHDKWHEGYLSQGKNNIVANSRLTRAALDKDLARWISTAPFSPRKWRPLYITELLKEQPKSQRQISTKVLADVVEALIGAALVDGGFYCAAICAHVFLDEIEPIEVPQMLQQYLEKTQHERNTAPICQLSSVQDLLGYTFTNPVHLLSAITHSSLTSDLTTPSYQRLEFLGDAVLDMVIVQRLAAYTTPALNNVQMHLIKSALVNADFLAFLCMEAAIEDEVFEIEEVHPERHMDVSVHTVRKTRRVALCDFMRYHSAEVSSARQACRERYERLAPTIREAILREKRYPWALLAQLGAPKFISDLLEAVLGAIFVDSTGDLNACVEIAERLDILRYLRRIVNDEVDVLHPKTRLGELAATGAKKKEKHERRVKYTLRQEEGEKGGYRCFVSIGGVSFEEARNGISREEITVRAADNAVRTLVAA